MRFRILVIICFSFFTFQAKSAAPATGYEMKFKINGLKDTLCYLANYYGEKQYLKDSVRADKNGLLVFKGKEALPGGIYLFVFPNKTYFELLVDKQQFFSMECDQAEVISSMTIKGSEDNDLFYAYLRFIQDRSKEVEGYKSQRQVKSEAKESTDELDKKIKGVDQSVIDYKMKFIIDHPGSFLATIFKSSEDPIIPEAPKLASSGIDSTFALRYYRAHYFDSMDLSDERLLRTPVYHNKVSYYMKNLVLQMPDSVIPEAEMLIDKAAINKETFKYMVWYMTNTYETSNIMGMDAVFVALVKKYYTKEKAYWVDDATLYKIQDRAQVLEPILLGKTVKNLILADSMGVYKALHDVKAKFTILYFWDPDCGHCKKATPKVKAYYDKVKSKGVEVYAVCTEVEMEKWKNYIQENNLNWINVADPKLQNNFRNEFDVKTTPQIFILDKDKKILAKKIDEDTLEKILDKELELPTDKKP